MSLRAPGVSLRRPTSAAERSSRTGNVLVMARRASYENSKKEDGESHWPRHSGDEVQPLEERVRMVIERTGY